MTILPQVNPLAYEVADQGQEADDDLSFVTSISGVPRSLDSGLGGFESFVQDYVAEYPQEMHTFNEIFD